MSGGRRHPLDTHFRALPLRVVSVSAGYRERTDADKSELDGGGCSRRRRQPAPRLRGPRAAAAGARLLHDRLGRPRGQRAGGDGARGRPTRRCCTTAPAASTVARARQVPGSTPVRDVLQGLVALADEPIAGGRHKVFGHADLAIIPQTSTIASHLPRAVGLALALSPGAPAGRGLSRGRPTRSWSARFGDASVNHSTAAGAINTALNAAYRGCRCRCCSSARTTVWASACRRRPAGSSARTGPGPGWATSPPTAPTRRPPGPSIDRGGRLASASSRRPVFLHLRTVRLLGHAGSDAEIGYRATARRSRPTTTATRCWRTARVLVERAASSRPTMLGPVRRDPGARSMPRPTELPDAPRLRSAAEVMAPRRPAAARIAVARRAAATLDGGRLEPRQPR